MPISNEGRISLDFTYSFASPEPKNEGDQESTVYQLRFHYTEIGPTITFLDEEGKVTDFSLPAEMFSEVSDFLVSRGVYGNKLISHQKPQMSNIPSPPMSNSRLGFPTINKQSSHPTSRVVPSVSAERLSSVLKEATTVNPDENNDSQDETVYIPEGIEEGDLTPSIEPIQSFETDSPNDEESSEEVAQEARKPKLAPRSKMTVSEIKQARSSVGKEKKIKPL